MYVSSNRALNWRRRAGGIGGRKRQFGNKAGGFTHFQPGEARQETDREMEAANLSKPADAGRAPSSSEHTCSSSARRTLSTEEPGLTDKGTKCVPIKTEGIQNLVRKCAKFTNM